MKHDNSIILKEIFNTFSETLINIIYIYKKRLCPSVRPSVRLSAFFFAMAFPIDAKIGTWTNLTAENVIVRPDF